MFEVFKMLALFYFSASTAIPATYAVGGSKNTPTESYAEEKEPYKRKVFVSGWEVPLQEFSSLVWLGFMAYQPLLVIHTKSSLYIYIYIYIYIIWVG